jgi:hypothetical protein
MRTVNLKGQIVTPYALAHIADILETDGEIAVINAGKSNLGSGIAAYELGKSMALSEIDIRLKVIEQHPLIADSI